MKLYDWNALRPKEQIDLLKRPALSNDSLVKERVSEIIKEVQLNGDRALISLTKELDSVNLSNISVPFEEIQQAEASLGAADKNAIQEAAKNITRFHEAQLPKPIAVETAPGVYCERITRAISDVGLYVPAGNAPLPSTALMLGIPAMLAGCSRVILCSPPQANGMINAAVLYAAKICNISIIFKIGGAQAIAAMAYGTESIPKVSKIFGPGNTWVTAAKAQVDQDPAGAAREMPAGPSEIMVIADEEANPNFVASDLLSQAEHGPDSQVMLISTNKTVLLEVIEAIEQQKQKLSRRAIIQKSLENSRAILVDNLDTALFVANKYAPEHLMLQVKEPKAALEKVQAAGSVFLGPWAPESIGDYCSGTNHVLPTYGYARSYSSLGVTDFLRSMTVQTLTSKGLQQIGGIAERLADLEGLDAHRQAVRLRLETLEDSGWNKSNEN